MKKQVTIVMLLLTFAACDKTGANDKDKMKAANWLLGNWENKSVDGDLIENWTLINDSTFHGQSYYIKGNDTIHFESIQLQQKGTILTYTANVKGQNEDKPIAFKLIMKTEKQLVFENLKNNYPQKISYSQITSKSFITKISGIQEGKSSSEQFLMKKIK